MTAELDLSYHKRFPDAYVPEAYEKLIHDCLQGQHANFVRDDELQESWSAQAYFVEKLSLAQLLLIYALVVAARTV